MPCKCLLISPIRNDFADCSVGPHAKYWPDRKTADGQFRGWKTGHKPIEFLSPRILGTVAQIEFRFLEQLIQPRNRSRSHCVFVLSVPGVHTAIVGTTKPERFRGKRKLLESRPVTRSEYNAIRERWDVRPETGSDKHDYFLVTTLTSILS